jgi:hypothetical protein
MAGRAILAWRLLPIALLVATACQSRPDPTQPFAAALNGEKYNTRFGPAEGRAVSFESGFNELYAFGLFFPVEGLLATDSQGLSIQFDPLLVTPGSEIAFGPATTSGVSVTFFPASGHRVAEGALLTFAASGADAGGTIRFDTLEPAIGGRVQGELLQATLYGFYENMDGGAQEPEEPLKLELWRFPFDTTFAESIFMP